MFMLLVQAQTQGDMVAATRSACSAALQCLPAEDKRPLSPAAATTVWSPSALGKEACDTCQGTLFPLWGLSAENRNQGGSASSLGCPSSTRQMHVVGMGGDEAEEGARLQ